MLKTFFTRLSKNLLHLMLLASFIVLSIAVWAQHYALVKPLRPSATDSYVVEKGQNLSAVARDLVAQNSMDIATAVVWVIAARLQQQAHKIKAGEYALNSKLSAYGLLDALVKGQTIRHSLTLVEGWNFQQVLYALRQHPKLKHTFNGLTPEQIMQRLGQADLHPEGQFYPDTYYFSRGFSDMDFLQRAFNKMQQQLDQAWAQRQAKLPLKTKYEALIMASIIEKETGAASERGLISGVFNRRLTKKMLLQTDPTVIYGLGAAFDGNITEQHLRQDTAYNTYVHAGLPPTPIAMPSQAALLAAVQPEDENYVYFVAKGKGLHHFSQTLNQHNCAVIRYQLKKGSPRYQQKCRALPDCSACR